MSKEERTRALRYKRPALASMGYEHIQSELWEIQEACENVQFYIEQDEDTLLSALDYDEEAEWEFKFAFAGLTAKVDQLIESISEQAHNFWGEDYAQLFDDCTVALLGNRYSLVGYDAIEEDYYALCGYDEQLATTEAGKRLMRRTKVEMIAIIGQCLVLVGDVLTLDDGVGVGAVHEVVKRADFCHVERLLTPCALEIATLSSHRAHPGGGTATGERAFQRLHPLLDR